MNYTPSLSPIKGEPTVRAYLEREFRSISQALNAPLSSAQQLAGRNVEPGVTDMTALLTTIFTRGGDIFVPAGRYMIAGTGADSGGVNVTITRDTRVYCEAGVVFVTDSLDNDFVRFTVPSNGSGLPSDGIVFEWFGGTFDQRNQKNSTVIPFIGNYPPVNAGASATCDALSIRGDYSVTGTEFHGIKRALVEGVTCIAGTHWETAGGDAGIFMGGCAQQTARNCRCVGSRDLAVYASGTTNATLSCTTLIEDCQAVNCFGSFNIKRSAGDSQILNTDSENCVRGPALDWVDGDGANRVRLAGNTGRNCGIFMRLQLCAGFDVEGNVCTTLGALLADGSSVETFAGCNGVELYGCSQGSVRSNKVLGLQSGIPAAYPTNYMLLKTANFTHDAIVTDTEHVMFRDNVGQALRVLGTDGGLANAFLDNVVYDAVTSARMASLGADSFELYIDPATQKRYYASAVDFAALSFNGQDVSKGANDSGGAGFAVLRVPN